MGTQRLGYFKRKSLLFLLSLFFIIHATAQKEAVEFDIAPELYNYYQKCRKVNHSLIVLSMCDTLFDMAHKEGDLRMQAVALCTKLDYYYDKGSDEKVIEEQVEVVKRFARETNQPKYYYFAWGKRLITYYIKRGRMNYALIETRKMLDEATEEDYKPGVMACYNSLGNIYEVKRLMDRAVEYRLKEVEISERYHIENYNISLLYSSLSGYYLNQDMNEKALELLKKAERLAHGPSQQYVVNLRFLLYYLNTGDLDKAHKLLLQCQQELEEDSRLLSDQKYLYETEIVYYSRLKQYDKALASMKMLEDTFHSRGETVSALSLLRQKADLYWQMGRREESASCYREYIDKERQQRVAEEDMSTGEFANLLEVQKLNTEKMELQQSMREKQFQNTRILVYFLGCMLVGGAVFFYRENRMNKRLKKSQEELCKAKDTAEAGSRMKSSFIQNMSHEIRTPLNSIIGFSQVLTQYFSDKEEAREYCTIIEKNSNDLLRLITDVLDLSDLDQTEGLLPMSVTDITCCCDDAVGRIKPLVNKGVDLVYRLPQQPIVIRSNPDRVVQVLEHLLYNASKFTIQGSIKLNCRLSEDGRYVLLAVTDTGIGILAEERERVFGRFVKLNDFTQGTGLGLPICRIIAEKLGGSLVIDSQYTAGCRFVLTLPFSLLSE